MKQEGLEFEQVKEYLQTRATEEELRRLKLMATVRLKESKERT